MSGVDFLDKLLDGVAVEWKPVAEVFYLRNGYTPSKSNSDYWKSGTIPWFRMEDIRQNGRILGSAIQKISEGAVKGGRLFPANSIIIATSATIGEHALVTVPHLANQRFTCLELRSEFTNILNMKFVFYYCFLLAAWCKKNTSTSSFSSVDMDGFRKFKIPFLSPSDPEKSLEIQAKIVRILDTFTELTAELTAELTSRKKQYNYYRDQLLSFGGGEVKWRALGDIGEFIRGKRFTKADYVEEGIRVIHYGEIYTRYGVWADHAFSKVRHDMAGSLRYAEPGDVVLAGVGETVEDVGKAVAWLGAQSVAIHDDSYAFRHLMNPKYVSYAMQTASFNSQKTKHVSSGKVKRILIEGFKKEVRIPVPYPDDHVRSLAEQARIVAILDKFDTLTNSISGGLPREIELHQKQYEYYRDLLLSFPKPEETVA
ncbi:restriction endonuclease subunit S [Pseudomonas sp. MH9.3]|uniref:restriction endonuclease subunit S n=1 Tax=Pseudomonas sp. MH9.3 TaxID=3048630 RepID=UPI002AC8A6F4|nr:restriction endonuclease subunit S [Pseudomonas sp. MH9.3]MEB0107372.1 restriction endonuclease subunit S [Pseudomonas sp. MH9.3]WPX81824.1 restriction endonuclease subunit S [Pseudomonas sp. MH9.3]